MTQKARIVPQAQIFPENTKLWTVAEVADLLRVGTMTIYRWVNSGELKSVKIGRVIRVREKDLRDILGVPESEDVTCWMRS
jgi:excisionase family DNA binding protein